MSGIVVDPAHIPHPHRLALPHRRQQLRQGQCLGTRPGSAAHARQPRRGPGNRRRCRAVGSWRKTQAGAVLPLSPGPPESGRRASVSIASAILRRYSESVAYRSGRSGSTLRVRNPALSYQTERASRSLPTRRTPPDRTRAQQIGAQLHDERRYCRRLAGAHMPAGCPRPSLPGKRSSAPARPVRGRPLRSPC